MNRCHADGCDQLGEWRLVAASGDCPWTLTSLVLCTEHRNKAQAAFAQARDDCPRITVAMVLAAANRRVTA